MKLFYTFLISIFVFLASTSPTFAQTLSKGDNPTLQKNQTINGDYFATGDKVVISGTVNGDAYVAGGSILIDGKINGDLLVAGGNVTIRGDIAQDVRAAGGNITISSHIGGNTTITGGSVTITDSASLSGSLVAGVGNLEIYAPVKKGMTIGGGTVQIGNQVGGDITAGVGELNFSSDANIQGNISYWSNNKVNISQGASISGQVSHFPPSQQHDSSKDGAKGLFTGISFIFTLASFLTALLLGILCMRFFPRFFDKTAQIIRTSPGTAFLTGLITFIVVPFVGLFLFITIFLIPLSILLMGIYFIVLYISKIFVAYTIGKKGAEIVNVTWSRGFVFAAGLIIYYAITSIPVIGWIISFVGVIFGLGALISAKRAYYSIFAKKL